MSLEIARKDADRSFNRAERNSVDFGFVEEDFKDEKSNKLQSSQGKRFVTNQKHPYSYPEWLNELIN